MTDAAAAAPTRRQAAMAALAAATAEELSQAVASWPEAQQATDLRPAECGLVMVRGRIGGDGAPFNAGEATVSRAVVRLSAGEVGYGYRLGRDTVAARHAAIIDALWQVAANRERIEQHVLEPIRARQQHARQHAGAVTASTRVDFFTLARETE